METLGHESAYAIAHSWYFWARPKQRNPEWDYRAWLQLGGRGSGKTATGAAWSNFKAVSKPRSRGLIIGRTAADVRDVMIEGESGLLAKSVPLPDFMPRYEPSRRRVVWPNGSIALCFSADEPNLLRGPQGEWAWCDEIAAWKRLLETWSNLELALRLGQQPQICATTTPKNIKFLKQFMNRPTTETTVMTTYENIHNVAPEWAEQIITQYEGTRLGEQELHARILDDNPNALWKRQYIEESRLSKIPVDLARIVVAVDPAVTSNIRGQVNQSGVVASNNSDETGIIVAARGVDDRGYVLEDASGLYPALLWPRRVVGQYRLFNADRVVSETNQGGDLVEAVIRQVDPNVSYKGVHASRGKIVRAEPVAQLYEKGRISHIGIFPVLEDEMCNYMQGSPNSPNRMDALVWAFTELFRLDTNDNMLNARTINI